MFTDQDRIDWLEQQANNPGGILLHDGGETGRMGLASGPRFGRTLRDAIDLCLRYDRRPPLKPGDVLPGTAVEVGESR